MINGTLGENYTDLLFLLFFQLPRKLEAREESRSCRLLSSGLVKVVVFVQIYCFWFFDAAMVLTTHRDQY